MNLRLAASTKTSIESLSKSLPQAILLTGPDGIGLKSLATYIVSTNGTLLTMLEPEQKSSSSLPGISVERVRELYANTKVSFSGPHFVVIDDADTMNVPAQNALLKLLEEPNSSIHFILTSHSPDKLLATIRSRTQATTIAPINELDSQRLVRALGVTNALDERRLLYIASGLPAKLTRLINSTSDFANVSDRVQQAKQFIEGSTYERLALIQRLNDDRQGSIVFIDMVCILLRKSLVANPNRTTAERIKKLIAASELIRANGNIRLQLSSAVL